MICNLSMSIGLAGRPHPLALRSLRPGAPSPGQEKGELCCGGHPHIPRQGLHPCNPFLVYVDQTSSPVGRRSLVRYCAHTGAGTRKSEHLLGTRGLLTAPRRVIEYRPVSGTGVKVTRLLPKQKTDGSSPLCRSRSCPQWRLLQSKPAGFPALCWWSCLPLTATIT